jgi:hypothetical protein
VTDLTKTTTTTDHTDHHECLFALLAALLAEEAIPEQTARTLERHLGLGWARDFASARSPEERAEGITRRLMLHQPYRRRREAPAPYDERVPADERVPTTKAGET